MNLNETMSFDHVIRVRDGVVEDMNPGSPGYVYAPELYWGGGEPDLTPQNWTLLTGYSGQYRYSGPIMHESEFIGGQLEQDILAQDGYYVAVVCYDLDLEDGEDDKIAGWAVAYREA